jgi:orotate phosphoribosyltransferase
VSRDARARRARRAHQILDEAKAIIRGDHFVYVNGDHGDGWLDKDAIFPHTELASELCWLLAEVVRDRGAEIVCGPATGGLIVSMWTAHHLRVPSVFAEHGKEHGYDPVAAHPGPLRPPLVLRRGYNAAVDGKRVLVVDDVVNTGGTMAETAGALRDAGGEVIAVAALATRGNAGPGDVGCQDFAYLTKVDMPSWPAEECELCKRGVPVNTRYAHGADFVAAQRARGGQTSQAAPG